MLHDQEFPPVGVEEDHAKENYDVGEENIVFGEEDPGHQERDTGETGV